MEILRKILAGVVVVVGITIVVMLILAVLRKGTDVIQQTRNNEIGATITNFYISESPFGPVTSQVKAGDEIYFNVDVVRPQGCFIDTSWRFANHVSEGRSIVWQVPGARGYAPPIDHESVSQSILVPNELTPGVYTMTRVTGWQCGDSTVVANNVLPVNFTVAKETVDAKSKAD